MNVLYSPLSGNGHIQFGKQLYHQGTVSEAIFEVQLAKQLSSLPQPFSLFSPIVLGAQTEPATLLDTWEQNRTYKVRSYQFWKTVITDKPEYRDAYTTLTVLALQMDKYDEAIGYLKRAYALDPNDGFVKELALQLGVSL